MFNQLREFGAVPFVQVANEDDALNVAKALADGGLPVMELAFKSFAHFKAVKMITRELPDFHIGAGYILSRDQLNRAVDCGAKFVFSPGAANDIIKEAVGKSITFAPGVCTPTDILTALQAGAMDFKFFHAEQSGGVKTLKAITEPFVHLGIEFFVSGGIRHENVQEYLELPMVAAVSVPWVASPEIIAAKDWKRIRIEAEAVVELIKTIRRS